MSRTTTLHSAAPEGGLRSDIVGRVADALAAQGLDAVVAISPENFAYLTGVVVPSPALFRWRHSAVVLTADGASGVLAVDMEATTVTSRLGDLDVRVWAEFDDSAMPVLAELLSAMGLGAARVGIETDYLPARDMDRLRALLPGVAWAAAQGLFDRARMHKTPREVEHLARLSRMTERAIQRGLASVHAGSTEHDLAGTVLSALYREGVDQHKLLIVASGERSQYPNVGPTARVLQRGDLVRLEIFGVSEGYHAGVCRTAVVQEPPAEARRIWENLVACRQTVFSALRPGTTGGEVYRRYRRTFDELGYDPIAFVGHGIGLHLHEEPYLRDADDRPLEAGMVLGVEPLLYLPGAFGLQIKDMVAVTEDGCRLLSDVMDADDLLVIP